MRASRSSLARMVLICLLGTLAAVTPARGEPAASPTPVTGTVIEAWGFSAGTGYAGHEESMVDGVMMGRGAVEHQEIAWSDPRLPSSHWMRFDYLIFDIDQPDGVMTVTSSHLLSGDEGSWRGRGRAIESASGRYATYELVGEGAYAGLYLLLQRAPVPDAHGPWDLAYVGHIFEGTLPGSPDPAEPLDMEGIRHWPFPSEPPAE